ncbi:hypothetical protein ACFX15_021603 [Malus domestica]
MKMQRITVYYSYCSLDRIVHCLGGFHAGTALRVFESSYVHVNIVFRFFFPENLSKVDEVRCFFIVILSVYQRRLILVFKVIWVVYVV